MSKITQNIKEFSLRARAGVRNTVSDDTVFLEPFSDWRNSKYEVLSGEKHTITIDGTEYYRIRALQRIERPFGLPTIEPGDLGGYISSQGYLSDKGTAWIADNAHVSGMVLDDAQVTGCAHVGAGAKVRGVSLVSDYAQVIDGAEVNDSLITDYAQVVGFNKEGFDKDFVRHGVTTMVYDHAWISGRARISAGVRVCRFSRVEGEVVLAGEVQLRKGAIVSGGIVIVAERAQIDICGEVLEEPMNRWGKPLGLVLPHGEHSVHSLKAFKEDRLNNVLPYFSKECPRVREAAQEIADIYGIKIHSGDAGVGAWAGTYDRDTGYPRKVQISATTGVAYSQHETDEEERERLGDVYYEDPDDEEL